MNLSCPDFANNALMPEKFTCEGEGLSPEFIIEGIPPNAKALALIVDDPDAPGGDFVHWLVYNMPVKEKIEENSSPGTEGVNTLGETGYCSPCPPKGAHRYFFKIYALDTELGLDKGANKQQLLKAMQGHILAQAELVGLYSKKKFR